jgi:hypothetical protein
MAIGDKKLPSDTAWYTDASNVAVRYEGTSHGENMDTRINILPQLQGTDSGALARSDCEELMASLKTEMWRSGSGIHGLSECVDVDWTDDAKIGNGICRLLNDFSPEQRAQILQALSSDTSSEP